MSVQEIANKIKVLESRLEAAKHDRARVGGRIEELMKRLETDFGFTTVEEAEAALTQMQQDIAADAARIENQFARLSHQYNWEV